jgi:hypothetical protein
MQEPNKEIYIHHRNGEYYHIVSECLIKENDVWKDGIIYSSLKSDKLYVRTKKNFKSKFKFAPDIKLEIDENDESVDFKKSNNYCIALNNAIQADLDLL